MSCICLHNRATVLTRPPPPQHTPTTVEVMRTDNRKLLVGYSSGTVVVFDMQTEKALQQISDVPHATHAPERQVNQVRGAHTHTHTHTHNKHTDAHD